MTLSVDAVLAPYRGAQRAVGGVVRSVGGAVGQVQRTAASAPRAVRHVERRLERHLARVPPARALRAIPETGGFMGRTLWRRHTAPTVEGLPDARLTPALVAQVAMDEAILAAFVGPDRMPRRSDYERVGVEVAQAVGQYQAEGWLDDPRSFHVDPRPMRDPQVSRGWALGMAYERLVWESGYEPHPGEPGRARWLGYATNRLAGAWVLRHPDDRPRPWLVCVHGFGMGYAFMDFPAFAAAHLHRDLGVNLAGITLPLHGRRKVGRMSGDELLGHDVLNTVHGLAQGAWDVRRLLGWVRAQGPTSLGLMGVSLGGYTTALVSCLDGDLDVVVAGIPVVDFPAVFRAQSPPHVLQRSIEHEILGGPAEALTRVVSPVAMPCQVPHEGRHVFAGLGDRMAHPRQAHQLWQHWGRPAMRWYPGNHVGYLWSPAVRRFVDDALVGRGLVGPDGLAA